MHWDGDASLSLIIHDHGDRWEFERVPRGTEWVAVSRGGPVTHILGARSLAGLHDQIQAADKQEDTGTVAGGDGV